MTTTPSIAPGATPRGVPAPIAKRFRLGTHRSATPDETLARARRLMPVLGITRVANVTGLDVTGAPVVLVSRPNARSRAIEAGRGLDATAAKVSGLMASIAAYHAERPAIPLRLATFDELRLAHRVADVASMPKPRASRFHASLRVLWAEGRDLTDGGPSWVPYDLVHADHTLPLPSGSGAFAMDAGGLAAGNHALEAISHGICDLVDRDAASLFHFGSEAARRRARVDPGTVSDAACADVLAGLDRAGVAVSIWETTSDVGVASFLCTLCDLDPDPARALPPISGSGCHPSRAVALVRALGSAARARIARLAGLPGARRDAGDLDRAQRFLDDQEAEAPARSFLDAPDFQGATLDEDVAWEIARLRTAGIAQVVAIDLTLPMLGIPVTRMVIPGLEPSHDAPGYVPGPRALRRAQEQAT